MAKQPSVFNEFAEKIRDEFTSVAAEGLSSGEFSGFIDTGCYILNALLSGSIYGGLPNNKIVAFAGEQATGKSFLVLSIAKSFLDRDPDARVLYYETEAAISKDMMEVRGIDTTRVIISNPETVQSFRTHALNALDAYGEISQKKRFPLMIILDSLGALSTSKETRDSVSGHDVQDMTRSQAIKAAFRTLTLKTAKVRVPLILTNHVYTTLGMYPTKEMGGGGGVKYAASTIVMLSKSKDKEGKEIIGSFIKAKLNKSRLTRENTEVSMKLSYTTGLDKYYGLLALSEQAGITSRSGAFHVFPNGVESKKGYEKAIYADPVKWFTPEIMEQIENYVNREFMYGLGGEVAVKPEEELVSDD